MSTVMYEYLGEMISMKDYNQIKTPFPPQKKIKSCCISYKLVTIWYALIKKRLLFIVAKGIYWYYD